MVALPGAVRPKAEVEVEAVGFLAVLVLAAVVRVAATIGEIVKGVKEEFRSFESEILSRTVFLKTYTTKRSRS